MWSEEEEEKAHLVPAQEILFVLCVRARVIHFSATISLWKVGDSHSR